MTAPVTAAPDSVVCVACRTSGRLAPLYRGCVDRISWIPGRFDVLRCTACGLGRTVPQPAPDELAAFYPRSYVSFACSGSPLGNSGRRARWLLRRPYARRYGEPERTLQPGRPGARLLDVGCGVGAYLEEMARLGWEPWGVDLSPHAAAAAAQRLETPAERIFVGRVEDARFGDESFDLVTMSHVLEHLSDPAVVLARIRRWLWPTGTLRIWVPNLASLEARTFRRLWFGLDVPRHLWHFTPQSLTALLDHAGFAVERLVPEYQASSLAGSVALLRDALVFRRRPYRNSRRLYYGLYPLASIQLALGQAASVDCVARKAAS